jgi:hypothetical protein
MASQKHIFIVKTPLAAWPLVRLWEDTWTDHIIKQHPEMLGKVRDVRRTLEHPFLVCESKGGFGRYVFVTDQDVNHQGCPLIVAVARRDSSGYPSVSSAYYGNKWYLDKAKVRLIWP